MGGRALGGRTWDGTKVCLLLALFSSRGVLGCRFRLKESGLKYSAHAKLQVKILCYFWYTVCKSPCLCICHCHYVCLQVSDSVTKSPCFSGESSARKDAARCHTEYCYLTRPVKSWAKNTFHLLSLFKFFIPGIQCPANGIYPFPINYEV